MKLQGIAIVFILIMLPLTLVLSTYTQMQISTLALQKSYDSKLIDSTYDAVAALQINTANEDLSNVADSFRSIVEASNNVFINTMSTNLGISNASKSYLSPYVPAILTTLYDGYYIYSPTKMPKVLKYDSSLISDTPGAKDYGFEYSKIDVESGKDKTTLFPDSYKEEKGTVETKNGQVVKDIEGNIYYKKDDGRYTSNIEDAKYEVDYILKPFSSYTARYCDNHSDPANADMDITINYTLDNYINVEGRIKGVYFTKSGYLVAQNINIISNDKVEVDGINIEVTDPTNPDPEQVNAINYYIEAKEFTDWVNDTLSGLVETDLIITDTAKEASALNITGRKEEEYSSLSSSINMFKIDSTNDPENEESNFEQHKQKVLRQSIQYNLNAAITAYNESGLQAETNFKLPVISNTEWSKILNNLTMVTFLQGMHCGTKTYNNYAVVSSTNNEQVVNPNSLFFVNKEKDQNDNESFYHRINCPEFTIPDINTGYKGIEFLYTNKAFKSTDAENTAKNRIKHKSYACYKCIVDGNYSDAVDWKSDTDRKKLYYTVLGKERKSLYKSIASPENYGYYYNYMINTPTDIGQYITIPVGTSGSASISAGILSNPVNYSGLGCANLKSVLITVNKTEYPLTMVPLIKYEVTISGSGGSSASEITVQSKMENPQTFEIPISGNIKNISNITFTLSSGQNLSEEHKFNVISIQSKYR